MALTFKDTLTSYALGRRANMEEWNAITRTKEGSGTTSLGALLKAKLDQNNG